MWCKCMCQRDKSIDQDCSNAEILCYRLVTSLRVTARYLRAYPTIVSWNHHLCVTVHSLCTSLRGRFELLCFLEECQILGDILVAY